MNSSIFTEVILLAFIFFDLIVVFVFFVFIAIADVSIKRLKRMLANRMQENM